MSSADTRAREAALVLHGMPVQQQAKVLGKLDVAQRRLIEPLLQELTALGIQAVEPSCDKLSKAECKASDRTKVGLLDPRAAAAALERCSAATIAALLDTQEVHWQQAVLAHVPRERRAQIANLRLAAGKPQSAKVLDFLCTRLVEQAQVSRTLAPRRETAFRSRVRNWLQWTR